MTFVFLGSNNLTLSFPRLLLNFRRYFQPSRTLTEPYVIATSVYFIDDDADGLRKYLAHNDCDASPQERESESERTLFFTGIFTAVARSSGKYSEPSRNYLAEARALVRFAESNYPSSSGERRDQRRFSSPRSRVDFNPATRQPGTKIPINRLSHRPPDGSPRATDEQAENRSR